MRRSIRARRALRNALSLLTDGTFRRRIGIETTRLDLERASRLSRLNGGDSQLWIRYKITESRSHERRPELFVTIV